jgi:FemAB-related protein (PEP-CTERM system-associated)
MSPSAITMRERPSPDWDRFVEKQAPAQPYWYSAWALLPLEIFGHAVRFLEARDLAGELIGVLPVARQKTLLGDFVTSLPFFNYGGVLGADTAAGQQLMEKAREWTTTSGCSYLELRDTRSWPGEWNVRTDKVAMVLELPPTFAELSKRLGSKLRSQVKRADRESPELRTGGRDLLEDFYRVFAINMRDLGTPVYPRRFFATILEKFPQACRVLVLYRGGVPHAAAVLIFHAGQVEIPWAACTAEGKSWGFNMKLYWEALSMAVEHGAKRFDFGRSTRDSGTFRFKQQWGAQPVPLYWYRWERKPGSEGKLMDHAVSIWRRLPLGVANTLGPLVSPGLPW